MKKNVFVFFIRTIRAKIISKGRKNRVREAKVRVNRRFYKGLLLGNVEGE